MDRRISFMFLNLEDWENSKIDKLINIIWYEYSTLRQHNN